MIEILTSGLPNVVQDLGRRQHLSLGVSRSGALDAYSLSLANIALGNDDSAAGLEISLFPFRLKFLRDAAFCCTGADCLLQLDEAKLPPWWVMTAQAGQVLRIDPPQRGARAYIAFAGGIDVPLVLGSRATDLKTGFGGFEGRGLRRSDRLSLGATDAAHPASHGLVPQALRDYWAELDAGRVTVGAIPAAEYDKFTEASRQAFESSAYQITPDANRMGYRLQGEKLSLNKPLELLSHGIVPGTVQIPPAGQPIIQLAEANTCGGYPKMATVILSDLWKLGQAPVGACIRFRVVDALAAVQELSAQESRLQQFRKQRFITSQSVR